MSLRSQIGRVRRAALGVFYRRMVSLSNCGPVVSFTFDDFPRSACSEGGAILERFGARGTYYVAAGLRNTSTELGDLFAEEDIRSLLKRGHEIGSHTFRHSSCRSIALWDFESDVERGMKGVEYFTGQRPEILRIPMAT